MTQYRFKPGEWARLPAVLKRRWWAETDYGKNEPSDGLKWELRSMDKPQSGVLKLWVQEAPWKMQSILQGGFRGPDDRKTPAIKAVNRWLRTVSQYNADPSKDYMAIADLPTDYDLCDELEYCTCHYTHHFADALRVVAVFHYDPEVRRKAYEYHFRVAEELFHFVPEDDATFIERHKDKAEHGPQESKDRRDMLV